MIPACFPVRTSGHFAAGATRRLSIKLGVGVGGFVKKDLRVEWD